MGSSASVSDTGFGPQLAGSFDFTLRFEHIFFSIVPAILAILAALAYLRYILRRDPDVAAGALLCVKECLVMALVAVQIASLALWAKSPDFRTSVSLAASALSCVEALCLAFIIFAKHRYSYRQSTFVSLFLSVTLLLDITKTYSAFNRTGLETISGLSVVTVALKFLLIIVEEVPKKQLIHDAHLRSSLGRETSAGFWNRSVFFWLNPTFLLGFRSTLTVDDLCSLGPEFNSADLFRHFQPNWAKVAKSTRVALAKAFLLTFGWSFFRIVIPRLAHIGFTFAQPFFLRRVIQEIGLDSISDNITGGLIGATALIYVGIAISRTHYQHYSYQLTTQLRGTFTVAVYDKMLRLSQEELDNAAAVTLVSTDLANMERLISRFHDFWACVVEIALGVYILATMIGPACVLVLGPAGISAMISSLVAKRMGQARIAWNEKIESRVAKTSNLLAQLKGVKMTGLAQPMSSFVQTLRDSEIKTSLVERNLRVVLHCLNAVTVGTTPVVAVAGALFWTRSNETLTAADIFTILSVVTIVAEPLGIALVAIPFMVNSLASLVRIQKFLCLEELPDPRQHLKSSFKSAHEQQFPKTSHDGHSHVIKLTDVSIESSTSGTVFHDAKFELKPASITMIFGPVGCGKTTLLKTILGETKLQSGTVEASTSAIGYCGQSPWLRNDTIRNNVVNHNPLDSAWYARVISACALDQDFASLTNGDQAVAGTGGCTLSGGQKQRVALARALYARPSIVVFDDVLSAVDKETTSSILHNLLGESGILRSLGTTVIMSTNMLHHLKMADRIFTFSDDGNVHELSYQGEFEVTKYISPTDVTLAGREGSGSPDDKEAEPPIVVATKDDGNRRRSGDFSLYSYYLRSAGIVVLTLWTILVALAAASERLPQIYVRVWMHNDPSHKLYFVGYAILGVFSIVCAAVSTILYYHGIVANTSVALHKGLLSAVMGANLKFISDTDAGSIVNRFSQDMTMVAQQLPQEFQEVAYMLFSILADIGILSSASKYTAAVIPFFVIVLCGIQYFYLRTSRQLRLLEIEVRTPLYTLFNETTSGIQHIRAFNWQKQFDEEHLQRLDYSQKPYYYLFCVQRWLNTVLDISTLVIAMVLVTFVLKFSATTSESAVGLALLNMITFSKAASYLVQVWVLVESSLGAIARIRSFCQDTPQEMEIDRGMTPAGDDWPLRGDIEFAGLCASYDPDKVDTERVLNDVSVVIKHGQKVGISGRSGSGKSSLLLSVLNMLDYTGSINISGREINTIPRSVLRSRIVTLTQDGIELPGSIRFNLDPFHDPNKKAEVSDEDMITALTQVELWSRIEAHGGLDVDMKKARLSQGQKQLFCVARAILRCKSTGSKIVLVDEATSSLDLETEKRVQEVMDVAFADCTVLTVSHRLHAFDTMDVLLEVDGGKVVEVRRGGDVDVAE